jgi:hypothetical protein
MENIPLFVGPEVLASGGVEPPQTTIPCPWNEELVDYFFPHFQGPAEQPPDSSMEWAIRAGREADAGRRRYSAYGSYQFRDGPQLDHQLHPSRSALRPLASFPVLTLAARCLEARRPPRAGNAADGDGDDGDGNDNVQAIFGSAADSLECRSAGTMRFPLSPGGGGDDGLARSECSPAARPRRPFSGLCRLVVAPSAAAIMEAHPALHLRRGPPRLDPELYAWGGGAGGAGGGAGAAGGGDVAEALPQSDSDDSGGW